MRRLSPTFLAFFMLLLPFASSLHGQDGPPPRDGAEFAERNERPNLLQALGLSQEQVRQIRLMNRDRKPAMEAAQMRLREANRALDMAIYGDELDEANVQAKLLEFQAAQAEVARIRFRSELSLRKILTPEQLLKFRALRARVARDLEERVKRRGLRQNDRPLQQMRQLPRQTRIN
ncbi:MAG: Spy/CpxP family protein refolding chaperone [Pyrinomonadaceae bacterium]